MELLKRNIHMDRVRSRNEIQFTLEEDRNVPDARPDASMIICNDGELTVDEIRPGTDQVWVRGNLKYQILYTAVDENVPQVVAGQIPFEEQVHMEGVNPNDSVTVETSLQDLTTSLINSRKLSIQSIISLELYVSELYDEETAVGIRDEDRIEYSHTHLDILQTTIRKKDIFRIREELSLPRELPNILNIIWKKIRVGRLEWKPLDGKLGVQGELHIFVLYETMDEENPVQIYQTVVPFGASVECQGSTENAVLDVQTRLAHKELEIHADNDGEERMLGLEVVMDLGVVMYEQEALELLSDVYAVTRQIQTREREGCFNRLLSDVRGRQKLSGRARLTAPAGVRKILNLDGHIVCDHREIRDQGVGINGSVELELLYQTGDKEKPFASEKVSLPFDYTCEAPGLKPDGAYRMQYHIEDLDASMLDSEEAEVNAGIVFDLLAFDTRKEQIIEEITTRELDQETMNALPGMVIYVVQPGDSLWKIGKRYYVPVDVIKELNGLTGNDIYPGDKLLLMKHSPT